MAVAALRNMHITSFKIVLYNDFDITDLGELKFILGILVTYDYTNWLIFLNQSAYIYQVFTYFGMQDTIPVSTLLGIKYNLSISQSPMSETGKKASKEYADNIHYLSLVRSLLLMIQTQPDIQFMVNLIA